MNAIQHKKILLIHIVYIFIYLERRISCYSSMLVQFTNSYCCHYERIKEVKQEEKPGQEEGEKQEEAEEGETKEETVK